MPLGVKIKYRLHPLMKVSDFETDVLIDKIEMQIKSDILPK
jgi:LEA14-like dessication related protein